MWFQKEILLQAKPRGFHLITQALLQELPELRQYKIGIAHFFIQSTVKPRPAGRGYKARFFN
ncbi:hypothetical protein O9375_17770 [Proteus mirabilis]|nr:hypothetical protein [Proteus mirabilis]